MEIASYSDVHAFSQECSRYKSSCPSLAAQQISDEMKGTILSATFTNRKAVQFIQLKKRSSHDADIRVAMVQCNSVQTLRRRDAPPMERR